MMTRKSLLLLLAVLLVWGGTAMGAILGTRHDMTSTGVNLGTNPPGVTENRGTCSFCHVPHGAQGARLWSGTPATTYTPVANLCYTCHMAAGVAGTSPYMFTATAHGFTKADLATGTRYGEGNAVETSLYPYTEAASTQIDCTSCHDAHTSSAGARPFIRTANSVSAIVCTGCHTLRANAGFMAANATGTHPVGAASALTTRTTKAPGAGYVALPTNMNPTPYGATDDWAVGQKQLTAGQVACISCHAVHGTETAAPATNDLTMAALDAGFCEDCHTANPGAGNAGGSHVVNTAGGAYASTVTANVLNITATFWAGDAATASDGYPNATNGVTCVGCHDTHIGEPNSPALVNFAGVALTATPSGNPGAYCAHCHVYNDADKEAVNTVITGTYHHPALLTGASSYVTNFLTGTEFPLPSLSPLAVGSGGAVVDCMTCHRTHNAAVADNTLLLTLTNRDGSGRPSSQICSACHTENPSPYTTTVANTASEGTHFVDNNTGRGKAAGLYQFSTEWTDGTQTYNPTEPTFSKYPLRAFSYSAGPSATLATQNGVICESCHSVTAARYNSLLLGNWNVADTTSNSICAICHTGMNVTTGTHPTLNDNVTRTGAAVNVATSAFAVAAPVGGDLFYPGNSEMTCASCHRPHDANSTAGGYALRHGVSGSTTSYGTAPANLWELPANVTFTPMCLGCHVNSPGGGTY